MRFIAALLLLGILVAASPALAQNPAPVPAPAPAADGKFHIWLYWHTGLIAD
jgi:hypothetical protein